jgi:hypothetical protein
VRSRIPLRDSGKGAYFANCRGLFLIFVLANCSGWLASSVAADRQNCPITRASDRPFVPPQPYSPTMGSDEFLYGSAALWTVLYPGWHVHRDGGKLPFFRQGFVYGKERPRLTVVARRLDGKEPLVWSGLAGSGFEEGKGLAGMFMVTGIDIPSSGCWASGDSQNRPMRDTSKPANGDRTGH